MRVLAILVGCLALSGCITDQRQAEYVAPAPAPTVPPHPLTLQERCQKLAAAVTNPYATPGTVEMGIEAMRNYHCLGN